MQRSVLCGLAIAGLAPLALPSNALAFECPPGAPNICAPATVIDFTVPRLLSTVSPGDAPLILRTTTLITASWFDAIAPYSANTVGVHSDHGRLDTGGGDSERNIAIMYASHEVLNSLMPQFAADWDAMMWAVGLDPDDPSVDVTTPVGVGNVAAFDSGITVWHNKRHYDAVRPYTAIGVIYGDAPVTARGGPIRGRYRVVPNS